MKSLSIIGRIFYGIAVAAMGLFTCYYRDFPYMLIPRKHVWLSQHTILVYFTGTLLFLAGACIVLGKRLMPVSLLLGTGLLFIFCFYFIPYELLESSNYMHYGDWENAAKEVALAGGAFIVAGYSSGQSEKSGRPPVIGWRRKIILAGALFFPLAIVSFGFDHFLYAKEAAGYIPAWIPDQLFWIYLAGAGLIASGMSILLKVKPDLAAALLGTMIFIWVIILHIPKAMAAPIAGNEGEVTSAFLALAYCGISFHLASKAPWPTYTPNKLNPF